MEAEWSEGGGRLWGLGPGEGEDSAGPRHGLWENRVRV